MESCDVGKSWGIGVSLLTGITPTLGDQSNWSRQTLSFVYVDGVPQPPTRPKLARELDRYRTGHLGLSHDGVMWGFMAIWGSGGTELVTNSPGLDLPLDRIVS